MAARQLGRQKYHDIFYLPGHFGRVLALTAALAFGHVTQFARHAGFPVERVSCRTDDCTDGDSQSDRLTDLPRPGQPFPRSLAQERGFLAARRMQAASE